MQLRVASDRTGETEKDAKKRDLRRKPSLAYEFLVECKGRRGEHEAAPHSSLAYVPFRKGGSLYPIKRLTSLTPPLSWRDRPKARARGGRLGAEATKANARGDYGTRDNQGIVVSASLDTR